MKPSMLNQAASKNKLLMLASFQVCVTSKLCAHGQDICPAILCQAMMLTPITANEPCCITYWLHRLCYIHVVNTFSCIVLLHAPDCDTLAGKTTVIVIDYDCCLASIHPIVISFLSIPFKESVLHGCHAC